jgi:general stress protein 26
MHPESLTYLKEQRVGVIAVQMPDGTPHGATIHFAYSEASNTFYFLTSKSSRKVEAFREKPCHASFVIATDENTMKTMQLNGTAALVPLEQKEAVEKIYLAKFPDKVAFIKTHGDVVYFMLTPTWWRYTDFKRAAGKLVVT